ncbi:ATP-binding cassette subfamily C protein LapB [Variovorax boronicumulans]|uniref:type I secretion system permease/ATPase n=1 Tax=Variovorax boronicumulans TaxID=436515 RepID=UPI00278AA9A1|nr:type I secretion system permease/ATPase [Variovorax boronicumulans]MDP9992628.1 ATP-binding cassette subfamily C protein LapB [Variovorax boronicumulans]MDQ0002200.1 ATP-binding cassette subfamily C protein LapB [Variovorax boronicumulans]
MTDTAQPSASFPQPDQARQAGLQGWTEALLAAAKHLELHCSPEAVRNTSDWVGHMRRDDAIIEVAGAIGLDARFVALPVHKLSPAMLPALVEFEEGSVGVITGLSRTHATLLLPAAGELLERSVPIESLGLVGADVQRPLLVHMRARRRDSRTDAYMAPTSRSWLTDIFTRNRTTMFELGVGSLVANLLAIATALFSMQVWDRVVPSRSTNTLWVLASGVVLALVLEFLIRTARVSLTDHFGKRADLKLSGMFFSHALQVRNDARPRSPGTLIAQLRDLEQLRELLTSSTLGVLLDLPFVVAFLLIIGVLGGPLVFVPLAAIPLIVLPGLIAQIPLAKLSREGMGEAALRNAILMESIYRIEDIKVLQAEPRFRHLWGAVNSVGSEVSLKQRYLGGLLLNFSQMAQQLAYVGVLVVGAYGILDGNLSFGAVLACSILTTRTIAPLAQVSAVLGRIQNARVGKKALDDLLALPVDHRADQETYHRATLTGQYRFENVSYSYDPESKPALVIPQFSIEPGERVAILGRVGSGKSTLLRLAGGLATPAQGRILLNGTPMNLIDIADIRRDVGILLQESGLFYGTIRENLLIANPLATDDAILEAMRLACADQLVLNQPHGLDFRIRENGVGLSGGQRQALILARTLLRSPDILLLDEPTASLDEATEAAIAERLKQWIGRRTVVIATHRYPMLSLVDRIVVLDGGRIVRDGAKEEILREMREGAAAMARAARHIERPSLQGAAT